MNWRNFRPPKKSVYDGLRQGALSLLLLTLVAGGCNANTPLKNHRVDGERAFDLAQKLVDIGPRHSNSPGARRTAEFILAEIQKLGYEGELDEWTETTVTGKMTFRNVYAKTSDKGKRFVLAGSHFDTKRLPEAPLFQGANDSASSTGLLLEMMRVIGSKQWDGPPVYFAFFDGEESQIKYGPNDGLHGSKRLAKRFLENNKVERCAAMVLLDMVGDKDLQLTISKDDDPRLIAQLFELAQEQGVEKHVTVFRGNIHDDHVPFKEIGIPAINLIDFEYGPNNSYWHTAADSMDKISSESLGIVGDLALRLIQMQRR